MLRLSISRVISDHLLSLYRRLLFTLWCWRRLLRVPWTTGRSNPSILKEINTEYSLERLTLKLKLRYFGHLMGWADSLGKTLMLEKIEGRRRRGRQKMRWLDGITDSMDMHLGGLRELLDWEAWRVAVYGVTKSQTWLRDWTDLHPACCMLRCSIVSNYLGTHGVWPSLASLPMGSHQERILQWVAMPFFRGYSQPRDKPASLTSPHGEVGSLPLAPPGEPHDTLST